MHTNLDSICLLVEDLPELSALLSMRLESLRVALWHRNTGIGRLLLTTEEEQKGSPGHNLIVLVYVIILSPFLRSKWQTGLLNNSTSEQAGYRQQHPLQMQ